MRGKYPLVSGLMRAHTFPSNLNCLLLATPFIECPSALYIPSTPIFHSAWARSRGRHRAVNYWHFNVPFAAHSYTWDNLITQGRNLTQPYIFLRPCCHQLLLLLIETESPSFFISSSFFLFFHIVKNLLFRLMMTSSGKGPRLWSSGPFSALQRSSFSSLPCRSLIFKIELCFKYIQLILLSADESEELSFNQVGCPLCHASCPNQHARSPRKLWLQGSARNRREFLCK